MIDFIIEIQKEKIINGLNDLFIIRPRIKLEINNELIELLAWGDPIYLPDFEARLRNNPNPEFVIKNIYGHYYFILFNKKRRIFFIGNSLFSILPLFYSIKDDNLTISNSPIALSEREEFQIDKRFILEQILFNYQLFNFCCIKGIFLLPVNSYFSIISGKTFIEKHTSIEDFFTSNPKPWRKSIKYLSDLFIDSSSKYFPNKPFVISLTGGFDGRTLVSIGIFYKKNFSTYCFGKENSPDVILSSSLSKNAGLSHINILLDQDYVINNGLTSGLDFIRNSFGSANFTRAHYLYAVKKLSDLTEIMITGNFGSEIFRNSQISGAAYSPNFRNLFATKNFKKAISRIQESSEFKFLNKDSLKEEWESLKNDLASLPCFNLEYKSLTRNQQFYKLIFEEVFRKYYGAEILNQSHFIINRTPYLDINFLTEILKSQLAGVNSSFITRNPLIRFKGQVLYAHIINKTQPLFGKLVTEKGYSPKDLLTFKGNVKILSSFIKNKFSYQRSSINDPYSVKQTLVINKSFWYSQLINPDLFNLNKVEIESANSNFYTTSMCNILSQNWWCNQLS